MKQLFQNGKALGIAIREDSEPVEPIQTVHLRDLTCPFCHTTGSTRRDSDFTYHHRGDSDRSVSLIHVLEGSLWCDFCQKERPKSHVSTRERLEEGL